MKILIFITLIVVFVAVSGCSSTPPVSISPIPPVIENPVHATATPYEVSTFEPIRNSRYVVSSTLTISGTTPIPYDPIVGIWTVTNMSPAPRIAFAPGGTGYASEFLYSQSFGWKNDGIDSLGNTTYTIMTVDVSGTMIYNQLEDTAMVGGLKDDQFLVRR